DYTIPQGWHTRSWTTAGTGKIPVNAFPIDGTLYIRAAADGQGYYLEWNGYQIGEVFFQPNDGHLYGEGIKVHFGDTPDTLKVDLSICGAGWLHGTLAEGLTDGNTGTYAADANPTIPPSVQVEELASA